MNKAETELSKQIITFPSDENMTDEAIKRNVLKVMSTHAIEFLNWAMSKHESENTKRLYEVFNSSNTQQ